MSEETDSARIDALALRVDGLEGRMLGAEDSATAEFTHTIEPGVAVQQTSDPKGRKPWEAEWSQEHGVLKVFIPDNAVVVDGQNVEVYSDDKDGSECTVTAGSWYLHVYESDDGTYEAEFDQESTGSRPGLNDSTESAKYDLKILDVSQDGGYVEKQYVVGSIVINENAKCDFVYHPFRLRAKTETRTRGESTEYRQLLEITNHVVNAIDYNGENISFSSGAGIDLGPDPDDGNWRILKETEWSPVLQKVSGVVYVRLVLVGVVKSGASGVSHLDAPDAQSYWLLSDEFEEPERSSVVSGASLVGASFEVGRVSGGKVSRQCLSSAIHIVELNDGIFSGSSGGGGGGSGSADTEWLKKNGVTSLNALKGDVKIIGGKGIEVSTDPKSNSIKITWNEDKEEEDTPPEPEQEEQGCPHPGGAGGVQGDIGGGGVPAGGGDYHGGDDSCCSN